jgi:hypothetical protein
MNKKSIDIQELGKNLLYLVLTLCAIYFVWNEYFRNPKGPDDLYIQKKEWTQGLIFKNVFQWGVIVKNTSPYQAFKDIKFKTMYFSESGKKIDSENYTALIKIKPKTKKKIIFEVMVSSKNAEQTKKATIKIIKAKKTN